jgi:DNA-binding response OmpR family regulator
VGEIILIASEWKARRFIMAQLLEEGYEVMALRTIEEAMMLLGQGMMRPHLIILDTAGQSLNEAILADLRTLAGDVPILVCTGPFDLAQFDFEEAGLAHLLVRPFTVGDVVDRVSQLLGKQVLADRNALESRR